MQTVLGITDVTNSLVCSKKIRRQFADTTILAADEFIDDLQTTYVLPFIDMSFIPYNGKMNNYLVAHGLAEINIYVSELAFAEPIYERINELLEVNYEDLQITYAGQASCSAKDILCYKIRIKPICKT